MTSNDPLQGKCHYPLHCICVFSIFEEKDEIPFVRLSESALEKEWKSEEDNIWDTWAKEKLKNTKD